MSDDERIERLTQLARRVPEWATERGLRVEQDQYGISVGHGTHRGEWNELLSAWHHPRAADALEAALLVLTGRPQDRFSDAMVERAARSIAEQTGMCVEEAGGPRVRGAQGCVCERHDRRARLGRAARGGCARRSHRRRL